MIKYFWYNTQATTLSAEKLLINLFHKMSQQNTKLFKGTDKYI